MTAPLLIRVRGRRGRCAAGRGLAHEHGLPGDHFVDLGGLKGNVGDQQYQITRGTDLSRLTKVVIWYRAFSVGFGARRCGGHEGRARVVR